MNAKRMVLIATCLCIAGHVFGSSIDDKESKLVLAAMARTPADGHPDEFGEFAGMQYYARGEYEKAIRYFEYGARYADKLSQLSIGLMYRNGEGVERNPVTAYAWLALAAERHFPRFVATRDAVWSELDATQREQARAELLRLTAEYGDAVAKPRMERALRRGRGEMTGSLVGYGGTGVVSVTVGQFINALPPNMANARLAPSPLPACSARTIDDARIPGCGDLYAKWRWDPKEYFYVRDAAWTGTVNVGEPEAAEGKP